MRFIIYEKEKITTVHLLLLLLLHLFFYFKLCSFFCRGRNNVSYPKAQSTLATPLTLTKTEQVGYN